MLSRTPQLLQKKDFLDTSNTRVIIKKYRYCAHPQIPKSPNPQMPKCRTFSVNTGFIRRKENNGFPQIRKNRKNRIFNCYYKQQGLDIDKLSHVINLHVGKSNREVNSSSKTNDPVGTNSVIHLSTNDDHHETTHVADANTFLNSATIKLENQRLI